MGDKSKLEETAARLKKVFGTEVTVSNDASLPFGDRVVRDTFVIKAGNNKAEAEAVIDKLIEARKKAGLSKDDLSFRSDDKGNIIIYDHELMKAASTLDKLEKPENAEAFQEAMPKRVTAMSISDITAMLKSEGRTYDKPSGTPADVLASSQNPKATGVNRNLVKQATEGRT
jgi:hypothetical protein